MIEAIAKIGKIEREKIKNRPGEDKDPQIVELIQNIYKPAQDDKRKQKLLKIVMKKNGDSYDFDEIDLQDLKDDSCYKALYRSRGGNALNPSPTAQLTDKDTFGNKILKFFKEAKSKKEIDENDKKLFAALYDELVKAENEIRKGIEEESKEKSVYLLTVTFKEQGSKEEYLIDKREFLDYFLSEVGEKEARYKGKGTCSICGKFGDVYGGVFPYSFFNLDKEGFLNNFSKDYSYKNFPICKECIRDLETGKKFIESKLKYTFVRGLDYRLVPQDILDDEESFEDLISILSDQEQKIDTKSLSRITDDEREILWMLSQQRDTFTLNFLFIKKQNKAEKILAFIQDVLPSRISKIFDAKKKVDKIVQDVFGYDSKQFTFGYIREFFFKSDSQKAASDLDKYFLDIVDKIFKGRRVDKDFLFYYIMNGIRDEFHKVKENSKENTFKYKTIDALMVYLFLKELNIIETREVKMEDRKFDAFFGKLGGLNDPVKKGLILLGAATQTLLEIQEEKRGSKPFLKHLKSLKMTEKDFKELLTKVQSKLEEYESLPKAKDFLEEASYYLLMGGDNFKMSVSEMNFYFAVGMNLKWEILKSLKKEDKDGEN